MLTESTTCQLSFLRIVLSIIVSEIVCEKIISESLGGSLILLYLCSRIIAYMVMYSWPKGVSWTADIVGKEEKQVLRLVAEIWKISLKARWTWCILLRYGVGLLYHYIFPLRYSRTSARRCRTSDDSTFFVYILIMCVPPRDGFHDSEREANNELNNLFLLIIKTKQLQ